MRNDNYNNSTIDNSIRFDAANFPLYWLKRALLNPKRTMYMWSAIPTTVDDGAFAPPSTNPNPAFGLSIDSRTAQVEPPPKRVHTEENGNNAGNAAAPRERGVHATASQTAYPEFEFKFSDVTQRYAAIVGTLAHLPTDTKLLSSFDTIGADTERAISNHANDSAKTYVAAQGLHTSTPPSYLKPPTSLVVARCDASVRAELDTNVRAEIQKANETLRQLHHAAFAATIARGPQKLDDIVNNAANKACAIATQAVGQGADPLIVADQLELLRLRVTRAAAAFESRFRERIARINTERTAKVLKNIELTNAKELLTKQVANSDGASETIRDIVHAILDDSDFHMPDAKTRVAAKNRATEANAKSYDKAPTNKVGKANKANKSNNAPSDKIKRDNIPKVRDASKQTKTPKAPNAPRKTSASAPSAPNNKKKKEKKEKTTPRDKRESKASPKETPRK